LQDELQQMQIPVRVWATIKAMVAADTKAAAAAASAAAQNLEARASSELAAAMLQQGAAQEQPHTMATAAGQLLHPDIMQRRMPRNFVGTGSTGTTYVQVTRRRGRQEVYTLQVTALAVQKGMARA
jgi:hypothetical protein